MTDIQIAEIIADATLEEARREVELALSVNAGDDRAYYCLGRVLWKYGHRSEAMAAYSAAVKINPDSKARHALEMAREVFDFFNPDLLNP